VVFLEDYDMAVARYMVQGCDVWLNTPLRPLEASGTSGMKALANGGLNLSTLDGWFDEAWRLAAAELSFVGWAIGRGEKYEDSEYRDQIESAALYELLEDDVVPTFYDRSADGLPRRWIANVKSSIARLCPAFNMHRVVKEYASGFYLPAHERHQQLTVDQSARAKALAAWRSRLRAGWSEIRVTDVDAVATTEIKAGSTIDVRARVHLGPLTCDEVAVELYLGRINAGAEFANATAAPMRYIGPNADGSCTFEASGVPCRQSGRHGYTVRVLPFHSGEPRRFLPGLIRWADAATRGASVG
jgi:starch phosphorylase